MLHMEKIDIYKAAAVIIQDRKLLVSRSKGKDTFVAPGGKLEKDEAPKQALVRELREEQGVEVAEENLAYFGTFYAVAAGHEQEQLHLQMEVYVVNAYKGELQPQAEIEENRWVDSQSASSIDLGSIFAHEVVPQLKGDDLID